ncbi:hypothetical protein JMUB5695_03059 [Mycobacterium heckeshornense]|uniref:hypothetical protein n=1 Tax=Mycobacterium heckeshornense TaxID=110505 RepID=UPI0019420BC7|nr:hypothetical protein [Mycobacterium heckeshornense]BCQ09610.1 hypothetical protein JMUB5695_03059 [Mycobacterium heckeshornense]
MVARKQRGYFCDLENLIRLTRQQRAAAPDYSGSCSRSAGFKSCTGRNGSWRAFASPDNYTKPWLNFEAGALSKKLKDDENRVTPVLVDFDLSALTNQPLVNYHAVTLDKEGMRRLCDSIARSANLNAQNVVQRFEQMWDSLDTGINAAKTQAGQQPPSPDVPVDKRLDALTASVKSLESIVMELALRTPQDIDGQLILTSKEHGSVDVTETAREVVKIAEAFRPVTNVKFGSGGGPKPKLDLVLVGAAPTPEEFRQFMSRVKHIPADVIILPARSG